MVEMQSEKLHAACDECRTRKLKCSGETPACSRCEREKIKCVYSPQKPMGRPRKRRREEATQDQAPESQSEGATSSQSFDVPPNFADIDLLSPSNLNGYSGFADFSSHDDLSNALLPPPYAETSLVDGFGPTPNQDLNFGLDPIDPSLWDAQPHDSGIDSGANTTPSQADNGPCTCLSIMYLTLTDLQTMTNFSFPAVIPRLRQAMNTASTMLHCPKCPQESFSAIQNVQSMTALLSALAERFHRVLKEIDIEAARLEQAGEKKPFRVGDNSPENMHLHTGTLDCPMGFNIELEASQWKRLTKQALRTEVCGGGGNLMPLVEILNEMERRQQRWHYDKEMHSEEKQRIFGNEAMCRVAKGEEAACLRMVNTIRKMVDAMQWD